MLQQTTNSNTERFIHGTRGIHAQQNPSGDWFYLLQDGLGSVRLVSDDSPAVVGIQHYKAYGIPYGTQGSLGLPYGFTGEQTDENALVYLRARHYSPPLGIFTALDPFEGMAVRPMSLNGYLYVEGNPIMDAVGELLSLINGYNYVGGNPVNRRDPSGMCPERRQIENDPSRRTTENYYDAIEIEQCYQIRSELRSWGVNVVWDTTAIDPYWARQNCLPEEVAQACNPEGGQRWTTNEMRAVFNAFKIFEGAHQNLGMGSGLPMAFSKYGYVSKA